MHYVLIVMAIYTGDVAALAPTTPIPVPGWSQTFDNQDVCKAAKNWVLAYNLTVAAECFPNDGTEATPVQPNRPAPAR